ncbi:MAG: hypothetical protein KBC34_05685 [Phenylobacterium sp.]|nr:hypothetical protein [Phenylobacterium sp.]
MDNADPYFAMAAGAGCLWHAALFVRRGWAAVVDSAVGGLAVILIVGVLAALIDSHQQGVTLGRVFGWVLMGFVMVGTFWMAVGLVGAGLGLLFRDGRRAPGNRRSHGR